MISGRNHKISATALFVVVGLALQSSGLAADGADPKPPADNPAADVLPVFPLQEEEGPLQKFSPANPGKPEDGMRAEALAWFMAAQVHYSRGERDKGLAALRKAVEKEPTSLSPYRA